MISPLAATILLLLTVHLGQGLRPVYAAHLRRHPLGAELRAEQLAVRLTRAAEAAQVEVALLAALAYDESHLDSTRVSSEGALGMLQLLPTSRWGRAWLEACGQQLDRCEALNAVWGAYALRDGLKACRGRLGHAVGFYRTGKCVEGPRARRTLALAHWVRATLQVVLLGPTTNTPWRAI
jgi:hypothetical protein